jgi:hypothetical protein
MTHHIKIRAIHTSPEEPVLIYSELDDARREIRKVEFFWDGSLGYASASVRSKQTELSEEPVPDLLGIAENPECAAEEISREDFETVWRRAVKNARP